MQIAISDEDISEFMDVIQRYAQEHPILIDKYLMGVEVEVDAVCDGEEIVIPGIKAEEARNHPDKNIITRAIGVKENVEPDIYEYRLKKGDIILMCTDGLSNMVEDEDMFNIVKGSRDVVEAVQMLIEKANSNGGRDNIGVIVAEPLADEVSVW